MKEIFAILFFLLVSAPAGASYREAMAGETQDEREIRWLWKYAHEFAHSCSQSSIDCQDPEIRKIARALAEYAPAQEASAAAAWRELPVFVSERQHPDFFKSAVGEPHRVMLTKTEKMSTVYVNTDRMTMHLQDQLGLLIHESVHHLGYADDEKRLPDRVGAEVARHFLRRIQQSSLEQFNLPKLRVATFNSEASDRVSVGFVSWGGRWTSDVGWEPSRYQPVCDPASEKLRSEFVSAPAWRINYFKLSRAIVTVRGGGYVRAVCENLATHQSRLSTLPLGASVDLHYPAPFDPEHWMEQTPEVVYAFGELGPSTNPNDHLWGLAQTFAILSSKNERSKLSAGEKWRTTIRLKSLDGWRPEACDLLISGMQYAVISQDHLPGVHHFSNCKVSELGNDEWQVEGEFDFPKETRPDRYYVPAVILANQGGQSQRAALPVKPSLVEVVNPGAPPPPIVRGIRVLGLPSRRTLGTHRDLTNSYESRAGQEFKVEFDVEGLQAATDDLWLDLTFWYRGEREFLLFDATGSSSSLPTILKSTQVRPVPGGTRISMIWRMPEEIAGQRIAAIKFRRFYVRTTDFSWAEVEMPGFHDSMVVNPDLGY